MSLALKTLLLSSLTGFGGGVVSSYIVNIDLLAFTRSFNFFRFSGSRIRLVILLRRVLSVAIYLDCGGGVYSTFAFLILLGRYCFAMSLGVIGLILKFKFFVCLAISLSVTIFRFALGLLVGVEAVDAGNDVGTGDAIEDIVGNGGSSNACRMSSYKSTSASV